MRREPIAGTSLPIVSDLFVVCVIAAMIYGMLAFAQQWQAHYNPTYKIDLSLSALPLYSAFSALRGFVAYLISLAFTLVVGYWAAKNKMAEKIILPILDVMQSIPVLGFLPGLVLGLVAIFPNTNMGLELASIVMIFTGQVWNMTFAFYSSLKSLPGDLQEAAAVMQLSNSQKFRFLELPFSAMNLTWNSVMSMAGGWFFLTVCEAFTLGNDNYRLPGLGAYMAVAIDAGKTDAIVAGIIAMALVIIFFDIFLWKPALAWAHSFRLEETEGNRADEPLIQAILKNSNLLKLIQAWSRRRRLPKRRASISRIPVFEKVVLFFARVFLNPARRLQDQVDKRWKSWIGICAMAFIVAVLAIIGLVKLGHLLATVHLEDWTRILADTFYTFLRVFAAVLIGSSWTVPVGIWVTQTQKRMRIAQPIIQLFASFPAPMLYPLAMGIFIILKINFQISSMLLMLLGVQWYVLFNVLAGALRIPTELRLAMNLMECSSWDKWRYLFLPSVFPSLVTGWVTAAGGAWNASIVSEVLSYRGHELVARGLGADISQAAAHADFAQLAACLLVMVVVVVVLNRLIWAKLYTLVQTRYRLDL